MSEIIIAVVSVALVLLFFQDVKHREIHVALPLLIFISSLISLYSKGILEYARPLYNIGFFILIFAVLVLYMSIRNKSFLNPFANYFGWGDVFYFVAIAPLFVLYNYIFFFILSMLFSIVLQLAFKKWMKNNTVPLAGFSALLLLLAIGTDLLLDFQNFTLIG